MRIKSIVARFVSAALVGAGVALGAFFFFGPNETVATDGKDPGGINVGDVQARQEPEGGGAEVPEDEIRARPKPEGGGAEVPEDETLTLTIPKMDQIEEDAVPDAAGDDEGALRKHAAIHIKGTGFPWEGEANVYLAGHRLGYPGTDSFLAFWDQNGLEKGDEIFVTDSEGTKYTYRVFEEFVAEPTDLSVTKPVEGKNVLTLQTCTLPDYSKRLITRAELVDEA